MELISWVFMAMTTLPRDLKMSYDYMESMSRVNYWKWQNYKVYELFDQVTEENRHKTAFRVGQETWSFHMVQDYSQKIATYFHMEGLQKGDVVAQVGVEGPQAVGLWLGLSRLGVATALLPSNLPPATLVKAASSVFSKAFICSPTLVNGLKQETLPDYMTIYSVGPTQDQSVTNLKKELVELSSKSPKKVKTSVKTRLLYLFSPNTLTPMPVTNYRYIFIATTLRKTLDLVDKDILYSPLPQSQPEGSIVAAGQAVIFGSTVVSGGEFAANTYFPNCNHYGATVALYNEDIVQKLMALSPSAADVNHKVRLLVGRGVRGPQLWVQFKDRFKVDQIGEYYGTVDSENYNMVNSYNKAGAVGFFPWFAFPLYQIKLVAYNSNTGDEERDENGLCVPPKTDQPGILLDVYPNDLERAYFSKNKKVIKDVFKKGDVYINTGDILKKDGQGYFYLVDTVANIKGTRSGVQKHEEQSRGQLPLVPEAKVKPKDQQPLVTEAEVKPNPQPPPSPDSYDLEKEFRKAEKAVSEKGQIPNDQKNELYGLSQQAKEGNVKTARPSGMFVLAFYQNQWDAWNSRKDMSKEEAMKEYIKKAKSYVSIE